MRVDIVSIFPDMFGPVFAASILGRAVERDLVDIRVHDLRDWTHDKHKTTDDYPYGGGAGMVMKVEPFYEAVTQVRDKNRGAPVILMTPQGEPLTHALAKELSTLPGLVILCGRYEGVDERVRTLCDREISVGDYVLTGGEIPAMALTDTVVRLLPGVVGDERSTEDDSHAAGLLEHPHYTRPPEFMGQKVPEELLSGHHKNIEAWRRRESIIRTASRRPDLLARADLTDAEREFMRKIAEEQS